MVNELLKIETTAERILRKLLLGLAIPESSSLFTQITVYESSGTLKSVSFKSLINYHLIHEILPIPPDKGF